VKRSTEYVIGINIGGTNCSVSLADFEAQLVDREVFATKEFPGPQENIENLNRLACRLIERCREESGKAPLAIGISCGGPLDSRQGRVLSPPNLPGWDDVPIVDMVHEATELPAYLENDANAGVLAEFRFGAGQGFSNIIFLTFGTGMGAGIILNEALYRGTSDMAGEVGHVRMTDEGPIGYGKAGSFEGYCSGSGIAYIAREAARKILSSGGRCEFCATPDSIDEIEARNVAAAAAAGDVEALSVLEFSAGYLGRGLALLVDILNPQCIVIGSIYTRNVQIFKPIIERVLAEECIPRSLEVCSILPSAIGEKVGDYGAVSVALYGLGAFTRP